ncbi:MAG: HupE/UreJ family protein, partial [Verrucomicrobiae bacterium]|nr:HupE/UreJ family protein [Verrucomicrobiae bacterium]
MTRCTVDVDTLASKVRVELKVDFTRMIGDPLEYHELAQKPTTENLDDRDKLGNALKDRFLVLAGETSLELEMVDFQFPTLPLDKYIEPWSAPMSVLHFEAALPENTSAITVTTRSGLVIEYPLVVTLQELGGASEPITRWLEPGQSSPALTITPKVPEISSAVETPTPASDNFISTAVRYLFLGYEHILPKGLDHILFVLGLFFLNHRWKPLLMQVSLFTLAHTVTLMLTAVGSIPYYPSIVEPLIALSIAYVGFENLWRTELKKSRIAVVFLFGLVHGMGFAGVLGELGLPEGEFITALLAFNVGVELGQLTVITLAFALSFKLLTWTHYRIAVRNPCNLAISAVALVW